MIENDKFEINLEKLKTQVEKEIQAERKYLRENDAKLRAVEQRVPTYEDFRQMVLASHLKPLDKGETLRDNMNKGSKVWNSVVASKDNKITDLNSDNYSDVSYLVDSDPKSNLEFIKIWKKLENNSNEQEYLKWNFLKKLGIKKITNLFKIEINGDLLGNFLVLFNNILNKEYSIESANFIIDLLKLFSKTNRFNLNMMFLKKEDVYSCKRLFEVLSKNCLNVDHLKELYLS